MVKTGQGLVLGALTGSWPQLDLFFEPASTSLFRFSGRWTLVSFGTWDWISPPLWLEAWIMLPAACEGGRDSVRGLVKEGSAVVLPWELLVCCRSWGCAGCSAWGSTWTWTWIWFSGWITVLLVSFWTSGVEFLNDQILATNGVFGPLGLKITGALDWRLMGDLRWTRMGTFWWGLCYNWKGKKNQIITSRSVRVWSYV